MVFRWQSISALCVAFFVFLVFAEVQGAVAHDELQTVRVLVQESSSKTPIPLVTVTIIGPVSRTATTDSTGTAIFAKVPAGRYRASLSALGYTTPLGTDVSVLSGIDEVVTISLSATMKTIVVVTVKGFQRGTTRSVHVGDSQSLIAGGAANNLNALNGVSTLPVAVGASLPSIDGHAPGTSGISLGGVPLGPPGRSFNLGSLNNGVFGAVDVDHSASNGALGGTLNFVLPDPTIAFQQQVRERDGRSGQYHRATWLRGTFGYLGISAGYAGSSATSPIDSLRFLDQSGLDYEHRSVASVGGIFFKVRAPMNDRNIIRYFTYSSKADRSQSCNVFTALVPCGLGPNNATSESVDASRLSDTISFHHAEISLIAFQSSLRDSTNGANQLFAAQPVGVNYVANDVTSGGDAELKVDLKRNASLTIGAHHVGYTFSTFLPNTIQVGSTLTSLDAQRFSVDFSAPLGRGLIGDFGAEQTQYTGFGPQQAARASLFWKRGSSNAFEVDAQLATPGFPSTTASGLSDPTSLTYDCKDGLAFGLGPSVNSGNVTRSNSVRLTWQHSSDRIRTDISAYSSDEFGTQLASTVGANQIVLPPGFLSDVNAIYASPLGCANPNGLAPSSILLLAPGIAQAVRYQGVSARIKIGLSANVTVVPSFDFYRSQLASNDVFFSATNSIVRKNHQLPGVPSFTAGLLTDFKIAPATELLVQGQYIGTNNALARKPFSFWSLAAIQTLQHGALAFRIANLTNTDAETFATVGQGVGLSTPGGAVIPQIGQTLQPVAMSLEYRINIGKRNSKTLFSPDQSLNDDSSGSTYTLEPFPSVPPSDALSMNDTSTLCGPEYASKARTILADVSRVADLADKGKFAVFDDAPIGLHLVPIKFGGRLFVEIFVRRSSTANALTNCGHIHGDRPDAYAPRGLFVPGGPDAKQVAAIFTRSVGLYMTGMSFSDESVTITNAALPKSPPARPFRLAESCTKENRGGMRVLMGLLQSWERSGFTGENSEWKAVAHHSSGGLWFGLTLKDASLIPAFDECASVSVGTLQEIRQRGFDASRSDFVDYTPSLGLYRISQT